jgi:hypothetical protein
MLLPHRVQGLFLKDEERGYSQKSLLLGNLYWEGRLAIQKNRRLMGNIFRWFIPVVYNGKY